MAGREYTGSSGVHLVAGVASAGVIRLERRVRFARCAAVRVGVRAGGASVCAVEAVSVRVWQESVVADTASIRESD